MEERVRAIGFGGPGDLIACEAVEVRQETWGGFDSSHSGRKPTGGQPRLLTRRPAATTCQPNRPPGNPDVPSQVLLGPLQDTGRVGLVLQEQVHGGLVQSSQDPEGLAVTADALAVREVGRGTEAHRERGG